MMLTRWGCEGFDLPALLPSLLTGDNFLNWVRRLEDGVIATAAADSSDYNGDLVSNSTPTATLRGHATSSTVTHSNHQPFSQIQCHFHPPFLTVDIVVCLFSTSTSPDRWIETDIFLESTHFSSNRDFPACGSACRGIFDIILPIGLNTNLS